MGTCYKFEYDLTPGSYIIYFEFRLPTNLPSTIKFKNDFDRGKPIATIAYSIEATLFFKSA